jgi:hypothetical protein
MSTSAKILVGKGCRANTGSTRIPCADDDSLTWNRYTHLCVAQLRVFTKLSARQLFEETFGVENVEVKVYGNVLAVTALLHGLAVEELSREELDHHDPDYELLITLRTVKPRA